MNMFVVEYRNHRGCVSTCEYETENAANEAIANEINRVIEWCEENHMDYCLKHSNYKEEMWYVNEDFYVYWKRSWIYGGDLYDEEKS